MTKFNKPATVKGRILSHPDRVETKEGGVAFKASPKLELYQRVMTSLVGEPKFYDPSGKESTDRIKELVHTVAADDPEFILKMAAYARNEMYLRSIPLFLLVEALDTDAKKLVRPYVPRIIRRADELSEVIALFIARNGEIGTGGSASLPNQFKRGMADTFHNYDAYQFGKYKRDTKQVKLQDVIRLIHPVPKDDEESLLFKQIRENTLPIPETWETVISTQGASKETWESVIPRMGYMAKLRNLNNFKKHGVGMEPVLKHLTNPTAVAKSKQFPFRFWAAYKTLGGSMGTTPNQNEILDAIVTALQLSIANIPKLSGTTLISTDNSGSMYTAISRKSVIQNIEIGCLMGAMAKQICDNAITSAFGTSFALVPTSVHDSVLTNMQRFLHASVGYATNGYAVLKWLNDTKTFVDRVMIFSDMQLWDTRHRLYGSAPESVAEQFKKYERINPNVKLYLFNLASYGTIQTPEDWPNVIFVSGWSEKIFDFIQRFEEDHTKALEVIETY